MKDEPQSGPADVSDTHETIAGDIERRLSEQLDELEALVREHPLATLGIAVGVGFIAALILTRR